MTNLTKFNSPSFVKFFNDIDKTSIGLDNLFDRLYANEHNRDNYPPYNLIKESDTQYRLELAVSGFKSNELTVYTENNQLIIESTKVNEKEYEYIHRSLSNRNFRRIWSLSDDVVVKEVIFEDGLLSLILEKIIPEHQKKKVFF
jgi:molecular chaperone IbpA